MLLEINDDGEWWIARRRLVVVTAAEAEVEMERNDLREIER